MATTDTQNPNLNPAEPTSRFRIAQALQRRAAQPAQPAAPPSVGLSDVVAGMNGGGLSALDARSRLRQVAGLPPSAASGGAGAPAPAYSNLDGGRAQQMFGPLQDIRAAMQSPTRGGGMMEPRAMASNPAQLTTATQSLSQAYGAGGGGAWYGPFGPPTAYGGGGDFKGGGPAWGAPSWGAQPYQPIQPYQLANPYVQYAAQPSYGAYASTPAFK